MTYYKTCKLINYVSNNMANKKWFNELNDDDICLILNNHYLNNEKKDTLNIVEKGQVGENKIERILIKNNIPYTRTSSTPHSGDFICYNKIMIDSKNYKNNITKDQIEKLSFDMNIRKINNGIMVVLTDNNFKFELKNNIIILYVSSKNEDYIWLYLEIFLNYINTLPDNFNGDIICVSSEINVLLSNYNSALLKLENIKNNLNFVINDLYNTNSKLKEIINDSLYIKTNNNKCDDIHCHDIIKKIITNIDYKELSFNTEKINLKCNNLVILINYKKKNEAVLYVMNINLLVSLLQNINIELFKLMNNINVNISNDQLTFIIKYDTDMIYIDSFIDILHSIIKYHIK